jgi:hypothetical protein
LPLKINYSYIVYFNISINRQTISYNTLTITHSTTLNFNDAKILPSKLAVPSMSSPTLIGPTPSGVPVKNKSPSYKLIN